jgi:hypothetical protein
MVVKRLLVPIDCEQITRQLELALQCQICEQSFGGCSAASHRLYLYVPELVPCLATYVLRWR